MDRKAVLSAATSFAEIGKAGQVVAHRRAGVTSIEEVADWLQRNLGQQLTAFGIGARDPRIIGSFARGEEIPTEEQGRTLRDLFEVGLTITAKDSSEVLRAWMIGANPQLADHAAIEIFHEGKIDLDLT